MACYFGLLGVPGRLHGVAYGYELRVDCLFHRFGVLSVGLLIIRVLLVLAYIRAPHFLKIPYARYSTTYRMLYIIFYIRPPDL